MSKVFLALSLAGTIALCPIPVSAQAEGEPPAKSKWGDVTLPAVPAGSRPDSNSGYDARALRLESNWGNFKIVRGADGLVVGKAGLFRTANVEKMVAGSARAESEAKLFRASHRPGAIATALGAVAFSVGIVASTSSSSSAATPIFMIGGVGTMVWGARRLNTAYSSLSRAIWWYNRDLVR